MKIERIPTENPQIDQWKLLGQFAYPTNVRKYFAENKISETDNEIEEYISGCVRQAESYYIATDKAPLDISPLLLYYGTANLLTGISALLTGEIKRFSHHGIKVKEPEEKLIRIADYLVNPCYPNEGALQYFCDVLSDKCPITSCGVWTVEEVFGSVPDLKKDFENCYENAKPYTIKTDVLKMISSDPKNENKKNEIFYENIEPVEFSNITDCIDEMTKIENFSNSYLRPQQRHGEDSPVTLYRKPNSDEIGFYSIYGEKFLELPHTKNGQNLIPTQLIILFMGLFALGNISRYKPQIWNPFVRSDITGERLLVEKFISISQRYIPNLVLNLIRKKRVEFYHPTSSVLIREENR